MMDDDMIATAVPRKTSANTNTNRTLHYISDEAMEERREEIGLFVTTQKKADRIFLVYTPHSLRWRNRAIPTRGHVKGHLNSMILVLNSALLPYASRRKKEILQTSVTTHQGGQPPFTPRQCYPAPTRRDRQGTVRRKPRQHLSH